MANCSLLCFERLFLFELETATPHFYIENPDGKLKELDANFFDFPTL